MLKNPLLKKFLTILAIPFFGLILLITTFIFDFLFQNATFTIINFFYKIKFEMDFSWFPLLMHFLFLIIISATSWFIFKSKLKPIYKAIYLPVPMAVVYATFGIFFYQIPIIGDIINILFFLSVLYYIYREKKPWIYYYALVLISLVMLFAGIMGMEI